MVNALYLLFSALCRRCIKLAPGEHISHNTSNVMTMPLCCFCSVDILTEHLKGDVFGLSLFQNERRMSRIHALS